MSRPYVVQFEHLGLGSHEYEFEVGKGLFEQFEHEEIVDAKFDVYLSLNKSANMMDLNFDFEGYFMLNCDRCNESLKLPINQPGRLIVKFGQTEHTDLDDLLILEEHEYEIDLSQFIYENLCLMIPVRHVHEESECDPEIIQMLTENAKEQPSEDIDPRWEKLKGLQN